MVANLGMDLIGHVQGTRPLGHLNHVALGGKGVDLVGEDIALDTLHELIGAVAVLTQFENFLDDVQLLTVTGLLNSVGLTLLVGPVGSDPVFRNLVHLVGPDLNLQWPALGSNHRGVQ